MVAPPPGSAMRLRSPVGVTRRYTHRGALDRDAGSAAAVPGGHAALPRAGTRFSVRGPEVLVVAVTPRSTHRGPGPGPGVRDETVRTWPPLGGVMRHYSGYEARAGSSRHADVTSGGNAALRRVRVPDQEWCPGRAGSASAERPGQPRSRPGVTGRWLAGVMRHYRIHGDPLGPVLATRAFLTRGPLRRNPPAQPPGAPRPVWAPRPVCASRPVRRGDPRRCVAPPVAGLRQDSRATLAHTRSQALTGTRMRRCAPPRHP